MQRGGEIIMLTYFTRFKMRLNSPTSEWIFLLCMIEFQFNVIF